MTHDREIRQTRDAANALISIGREDGIVTFRNAAIDRAYQVLSLSTCFEWIAQRASSDDSIRDELPVALSAMTALAEQLTDILQRES